MAKQKTVHCSVITPEAQVLDADATAVVLPAHDGQIGILVDRAPLLCELGTGVLRVDTTLEGSREFYLDGGFAQVLHNEVTILSEKAVAAEKISRESAQHALTEARKLANYGLEAVAARTRALARAKVQVRLART